MTRRYLRPIASVLSLGSFLSCVNAAEWHVDALVASSGDGTSPETAFKTIQEGIYAASHGDTVLVAKETYVENVHLRGKNIVLQSADRSAAGGPPNWYTIEVDCTLLSGEETRVIYARANHSDYYRVDFWLDGIRLTMPAWGQHWTTRFFGAGGLDLTHGQTYHVKIEVGFQFVSVSVDGDLLISQLWANMQPLGDGMVGLGTFNGTSDFDNLMVRVYVPSPRTMLFEGFDNGVADGFTEVGGEWAVVDGKYVQSTEDPAGPYRSWVNARDLDEYAIIDGNQRSSVVTFAGTENETCVVSGFAIVNGYANHGGGIDGDNTQATVRNNVITSNEAIGNIFGGGGLAFCDGVIVNNTILGNSAENAGGGLYACDGPIQNNTIASNSAEDAGGGLYECDAMIENNVIMRNSATNEGGMFNSEGGGLAYCDGTIQNNTITGNSAEDGGGLANCNGTIQNNAITGNSADSGGGLAYCDGTIQNNAITGNLAGSGGGLAHSPGTIINNTITANSAKGSGGGLNYCNHAKILRNTIADNSAGSEGGGINSCIFTQINDNTITGNTADSGGGLSNCGLIIQNNTITGNSAGSNGGGLNECGGTIQRNTITGNSAGSNGGGLNECGGTIQNNAITGNSAGSNGGGLNCCGGTIRNNTIVGNSAESYGGGLYDCEADSIHNCIFWGNVAPQGWQLYNLLYQPRNSCIQGWSSTGLGNISDNPWFIDADGPDNDPDTYHDNDYRLSRFSPCIDAGMNEDWMSHAVDLVGNARIWKGRDSVTVDMGAYEYGSFQFKVLEIYEIGKGGGWRFAWRSRPDDTYTVWSCIDFSDGQWKKESIITSEGDETTWTDPDTTSTRKFYRIEIH